MKKFMLFLAAFLMLVSPLAAGQAMSVTWEWLLDDPEVNYYRYQLDAQADDGWTVVDGDVSSYTVDGLDPYSSYTLYLQRSYDGVYWSASAEAVAEPLLVEDVPESADITPVLEEPVVEEAVEEVVEDLPPVLDAPVVDVIPEVAPAYVAEEPVEEPVVAIGEEITVNEDFIVVGEEDPAEKVIEVEDIVLVEEEPEEVVEEFVEEVPAEEPVVEEVLEEAPVEEEAPAVEEVPAEEIPVEAAEVPVEEGEKKNDFRFSLLFKGGFGVPLDFQNKIQPTPAATATLGFDFANIIGMGDSCGLGLRTDVAVSLIPNATGWGSKIHAPKTFFDMGSYAYTLDPSIYVTFDGMAGIVDFTIGAGFSGAIMFPNSVRTEQFAFNDGFEMGGKAYTYKLAPAALLGMRFYCGDVFSIGIEGTYRATVGDWMHHDVTANLVMGFSF